MENDMPLSKGSTGFTILFKDYLLISDGFADFVDEKRMLIVTLCRRKVQSWQIAGDQQLLWFPRPTAGPTEKNSNDQCYSSMRAANM
jgi:hypothetical protein